MTKRKRVVFVTKKKLEQVNPKNIQSYESYLRSRIAVNNEVKDTTYKTYRSYFNQFLVYLLEHWDNVNINGKKFRKDAVDIMEGFMYFCQDTLGNNKKVINTKISAVSSYFHWAVKRGELKHHPFDGKLERVQGARDEKIIAEHYLTQEEVDTITKALEKRENGYDIVDQLIWGIMIDSANRVGAIHSLNISDLDLEEMKFDNIREKRGKRVEVVFNNHTAEIIKEWLELREEMDELKNDAFFVTYYGEEYRRMSKQRIQERIREIGKIIGLDDFRSHSIRKTALNIAFELTNDLGAVADLANHSSVETTQQSYIRPRSKTEIREKLNKIRREQG
mgnify:FL=1